jgi:hypothetical protein
MSPRISLLTLLLATTTLILAFPTNGPSDHQQGTSGIAPATPADNSHHPNLNPNANSHPQNPRIPSSPFSRFQEQLGSHLGNLPNADANVYPPSAFDHSPSSSFRPSNYRNSETFFHSPSSGFRPQGYPSLNEIQRETRHQQNSRPIEGDNPLRGARPEQTQDPDLSPSGPPGTGNLRERHSTKRKSGDQDPEGVATLVTAHDIAAHWLGLAPAHDIVAHRLGHSDAPWNNDFRATPHGIASHSPSCSSCQSSHSKRNMRGPSRRTVLYGPNPRWRYTG